ncbi:acetylornithine/succinylornithine family transaminase [Paenibacillus sp. LMG 31456]|uniref:Acetylornithine/succinylornithine family transaminase n=1 Tax=Paenibacillus foliorum TaxID=2654974 RepID=A0A972H1E3_9BACL|nr:acetylornithine/succinylornithine family transaminase [Paenibacillus foliorum]NOU98058.1 acetylornithine/succinylornithine family transaminase [Paenibacillus foliorum]
MEYQVALETSQLLDEAKKSILFTAARPELVMERGEGMYLWDTDGKRYLDFVGGWAVTCLGHSPEIIREALNRQAGTLINSSPSFYNKPMIELASLLTGNSCFDRVFFASSGAEANEGAIKLARKHGQKNLGGAFEIITTTNSFHGRTLAMMSATGKQQWESLFSPKVPGFKHVPLNDIEACLEAINPNTCAIMLELIQGEGGVHTVDAEYLNRLRKVCDDLGLMLIFDEIQTGLGRTGKLFAYEHYGIEADVMTLGKGIGGGFPLSALLVKEPYNIFEPGDQGGTYSGQPLAMAVGFAVVNEIINKELSYQAEEQGNYLMNSLREIAHSYQLKQLRGKGLLLAFDLPEARGTELVSECLKDGLLINSPNSSTVRLMPPLIVSKDEIDNMLQILCGVLDRLHIS